MISTTTTILSEEKKAKEYYSIKLELLTNATVVDDAIRFVSQKSKQRIKSSGEDEKQADYEDRDQLQEEQGEEETGEVTTTNQVF